MREFGQPLAQTIVLYLTVAMTVVVLLAAFHLDLRKSSRTPEDAHGCDWFGYLRQARLFREHGAIGGLDTAIRDDRTRYLIAVAKRTGEPLALWDEGIAPHCHHYVAASDRVILQYPPGTGFLFSFFPEGAQARSGFVVSALIVFIVLLIAALSARIATVPLLVLALGSVFFAALFRFSEEWSVPLSGAVLLVAGFLTVSLATAETPRQRIVRAALLGFVLGLSVDVRMMNLFIAIGPLAVLFITFLKRPSWSSALPSVGASIGLMVGLIPLFAFNVMNVGHPLSTTYNRADTSVPVATWEMISKALWFYFGPEPLNRMFTVAGLLVIAIIVVRRRVHTERVTEAAFAGALSLAISLVFVLTHWVMIPYYLFPAAGYAAAIAFFSLVASENEGARQQGSLGLPLWMRGAVVVLALLATVPVMRRQSMPLSPFFAEPTLTTAIEPSAIVWGDLGTGNVNYFLHRQAAKFVELSAPMQERFIAEIAKDGVRQYLLNDSPRMDDIIGQLVQASRARKSTRILEYDVYTIDPTGSALTESANR